MLRFVGKHPVSSSASSVFSNIFIYLVGYEFSTFLMHDVCSSKRVLVTQDTTVEVPFAYGFKLFLQASYVLDSKRFHELQNICPLEKKL